MCFFGFDSGWAQPASFCLLGVTAYAGMECSFPLGRIIRTVYRVYVSRKEMAHTHPRGSGRVPVLISARTEMGCKHRAMLRMSTAENISQEMLATTPPFSLFCACPSRHILGENRLRNSSLGRVLYYHPCDMVAL